MKRSLAGRTILITGASKGIGRALALRAAEAGMQVALMARGPAALSDLAEKIASHGGRALPLPADVADPDACRRAVAETESSLAPIDVLVNNAGYGLHARLEETPPSEARRIVEVNLLGSFFATAAVVPGMRARRRGHVVFVSSAVGKKGIAGYSLYSATKFGQVGLADALRAEVEEEGISVSVVYPVSTATEFRAAMVRAGSTDLPLPGGGPLQLPDRVAAAVMRCLERPRAEVYPYRPLKFLAILNQVFPETVGRIIARARRRAASAGS